MRTCILFLLLTALSCTCLNAQSRTFTRLDNPLGGSLGQFVFAPDGTIYGGNEGSGIHYSTDQGRSWEPLYSGVNAHYPAAAFDDGTIISILALPGRTELQKNNSPFGTWQTITPEGSGEGHFVNNAVRMGGQLFVGTVDGLLQSSDTGTTWEKAGFDGLAIVYLTAAGSSIVGLARPSQDVTGPRRLFRSVDSGTTWSEFEHPDGKVLAGIEIGGDVIMLHYFGKGLFTWPFDSEAPVPFDTSAGVKGQVRFAVNAGGDVALLHRDSLVLLWYDSQGRVAAKHQLPQNFGYIRRITFAPDGALLSSPDYHGVYRSLDSGAVWERTGLKSATAFHDIRGLKDGGLLCSTDQGIFHMSSDEIWREIPSRFQISLLAIDSTGRWLGATLSKMVASSDEGEEWTMLNISAEQDFQDLVVSPTGAILCIKNEQIFRSTDGGESWHLTLDKSRTVERIEVGLHGTIWAVGFNRVVRSTDDGITWKQLPFSSTGATSMYPSSLSVTDDGTLLIAHSEQRDSLLRTDDDGLTWHQVAGPCDSGVLGFLNTVDGLLALTPCGLYRSGNAGLDWEFLADSPPGIVHGVMRSTSGGRIYVGTEQGIYRLEGISSVEERGEDRREWRLNLW